MAMVCAVIVLYDNNNTVVMDFPDYPRKDIVKKWIEVKPDDHKMWSFMRDSVLREQAVYLLRKEDERKESWKASWKALEWFSYCMKKYHTQITIWPGIPNQPHKEEYRAVTACPPPPPPRWTKDQIRFMQYVRGVIYHFEHSSADDYFKSEYSYEEREAFEEKITQHVCFFQLVDGWDGCIWHSCDLDTFFPTRCERLEVLDRHYTKVIGSDYLSFKQRYESAVAVCHKHAPRPDACYRVLNLLNGANVSLKNSIYITGSTYIKDMISFLEAGQISDRLTKILPEFFYLLPPPAMYYVKQEILPRYREEEMELVNNWEEVINVLRGDSNWTKEIDGRLSSVVRFELENGVLPLTIHGAELRKKYSTETIQHLFDVYRESHPNKRRTSSNRF